MTRDSAKAEYSQLVDRHKGLRNITRRLHNDVLPRYLSKKAFDVCGRKLGIMRDNTLVFASMDQTAVLMDYCIYDYRQEGCNAVSRYIVDSQLDADSDEYAVARAMSESFHTLVQVVEVLHGVGVRANDLFGGRQFLIVDMGLGETAVQGVVIATRILPFEDFVITSGAPLPVDAETLSEIRDSILPQFGTEDGQYLNVDMQQKANLTAAIIRACLRSKASSGVEYQDVGIEPVAPPLRIETRVGRNDPCPCGSGRKYKRYCGR